MMLKSASFTLANNFDTDMVIVHEPEAFEFILPPGEEVLINTYPAIESVQINMWMYEGKVHAAIWSCQVGGGYSVWYKGENAFRAFLD